MPQRDHCAKFFVFLLSVAFVCASSWGQSNQSNPSIPSTGQSTGRLDFADKVRLVSCQPSTEKPCFRLKLNVVDAQGAPLDVNLPPNKDLRGQLQVYLDDQEIDPFFAISQNGVTQTVRGRIALILVDISGSMNIRLASGRTRFETAQAALSEFLNGFDGNVDRVAIVPFESHYVEQRIRAADFANSRARAESEIAGLPTPGPKNNTALYSAVKLGLQVLAQQQSTVASGATSPEMLLIVMTDGKNEVLSGDDYGLLDGQTGLEEAAAAVQKSGIEVMGIGFGDPGSIDDAALRRISTKTYMANDLEGLKQIYSMARTLLTNRISATFASPWEDRASLEGRTLHVRTVLNLPGGQQFQSAERIWSAPQMSVPTFEGKCDTEELRAALPNLPGSTNWLSLLRPAVVFVGLGTLLLVLWYWVPRLIWPDQYIGSFPTPSGNMRWASMSRAWSASRIRAGPAPPGFQSRKGGAQPPRTPLDRTVAQPHPDFSRSRVQRRPPDDRD